jgi:hypothetical protein
LNNNLFCDKCSGQLQSIDEIESGICINCKSSSLDKSESDVFPCWACKKSLISKKEIAQGVCDNCKAYILKKLK